jgi:ankyrin repeat protein
MKKFITMYLLILNSFSMLNTLCMEPEKTGPSFKTCRSLTLRHDRFEDLLMCNAVLLKKIAGQVPEHEKLFVVENTLRVGLESENYNALHGQYGEEILHYARLIAYRADDCRNLIGKINQYDTYGAEKIIERNPHLAHYLPVQVPHGQTLLHHVLDMSKRRQPFEENGSSFLNRFIVIAHALLKAGANPNATDFEGNTCMHFVCTPEHINLLLEFGGAIDAQNKKGNSPLMHLYARGVTTSSAWGDPLQHLLNGGANPDVQNEEGDTAFHEAVKKRDASWCYVLLRYGASFMIPNKKGKTAVCDLHQGEKSLRKTIEPYMQQFLWNKIIENEWEVVKSFLQRYPWINLIVNGKHLVKWARERNPELARSFSRVLEEIKSDENQK